jgi:DNA-binding YbaB/EbfC family protein
VADHVPRGTVRDDDRMPDDPHAQLPDLGSLLGMAMDLQQKVAAAQEEAATNVVEGQAGGGAVRIAVTGGFEFRSVTITPEALDPDDVEMLQDLVLAALHDAVDRVYELQTAASPMAAMGGLDLGSLDLGPLAGALGVPEVVEVDEDDDDEVAEPDDDAGAPR